MYAPSMPCPRAGGGDAMTRNAPWAPVRARSLEHRWHQQVPDQGPNQDAKDGAQQNSIPFHALTSLAPSEATLLCGACARLDKSLASSGMLDARHGAARRFRRMPKHPDAYPMPPKYSHRERLFRGGEPRGGWRRIAEKLTRDEYRRPFSMPGVASNGDGRRARSFAIQARLLESRAESPAPIRQPTGSRPP